MEGTWRVAAAVGCLGMIEYLEVFLDIHARIEMAVDTIVSDA